MHQFFFNFILFAQIIFALNSLGYSAENQNKADTSALLKQAICDELVTAKAPNLNLQGDFEFKGKTWARFKSPFSEAEAIRFLFGDSERPWLSSDLAARWKIRKTEELEALKKKESLDFCQKLGSSLSPLKLLTGESVLFNPNLFRLNAKATSNLNSEVLVEDDEARSLVLNQKVSFGGWIDSKEVKWFRYLNRYYIRIYHPLSKELTDVLVLNTQGIPIARLQKGKTTQNITQKNSEVKPEVKYEELYYRAFENLINQVADDTLAEMKKYLMKKYVLEEVEKELDKIKKTVEYFKLLIQAYLISPEQDLKIVGLSKDNRLQSNMRVKDFLLELTGILNEISAQYEPISIIPFKRQDKVELIYLYFLDEMSSKHKRVAFTP